MISQFFNTKAGDFAKEMTGCLASIIFAMVVVGLLALAGMA